MHTFWLRLACYAGRDGLLQPDLPGPPPPNSPARVRILRAPRRIRQPPFVAGLCVWFLSASICVYLRPIILTASGRMMPNGTRPSRTLSHGPVHSLIK